MDKVEKVGGQLDMIYGKPGRVMVQFAIPIILGNLFQQFYNMVDSIVVGKFVGEDALASVGAVSYTHLDVYKRQLHTCLPGPPVP